MEEKIIVVHCNKADYYLARICIASIRYYYPDAPVYLVKDLLNGDFSTQELEDAFNIKLLGFEVTNFGWGASKLFTLLTDEFPADKRIMVLDGDIVFIGKFLEDLYEKTKDSDFVIDAHYVADPRDKFYKENCGDYDAIKKEEPDYIYPGFVFNSGQLIARVGKISELDLQNFFDRKTFPYYKKRHLIPLPDQTMLNIVLAKKHQKNEAKVSPQKFMLWSDEENAAKVTLEKVKEGKYPYLIHWAGSAKTPLVDKMVRGDILDFFQDYYYSKVPNGAFKKKIRQVRPFFKYHNKNIVTVTKANLMKTALGKQLKKLVS